MRIERIGDATLYLGDCLEILPTLDKVDAVVTDPPYPDYLACEFNYRDDYLIEIDKYNWKMFVFWSCKSVFPIPYSARHVWVKTGAGMMAAYEFIYEVRGKLAYKVFKGNAISNQTMARFSRDTFADHPTQKPRSLMTELVSLTTGAVLDPFMGSGTTGVACANLGRKFIGIEIEEKYFDIACERITAAYAQGRLFE